MPSTELSRDNGYQIPPGANADRGLFQSVFTDVDVRLVGLEALQVDYETTIEQLTTQALNVITQTISAEIVLQRATLEQIQDDAQAVLAAYEEISLTGVPGTQIRLSPTPQFAPVNVQAGFDNLVPRVAAAESSVAQVDSKDQAVSSSVLATLRDSVPAAYNTLKRLYDLLIEHTSRTNNPHAVTKAQVGLANADNTSDANKPISTATTTALSSKVNREVNVVGLGDVVVASSWTQIYVRLNDNSVRKLVTDISENRMAMYYGAGFPIIRVDSTDFQVATRQYAVEQYNSAIAANQHDIRELRWVHAGENPVATGWNSFGQARNVYGISLNSGAGVNGLRLSALQAYSFDRGWFTIEG